MKRNEDWFDKEDNLDGKTKLTFKIIKGKPNRNPPAPIRRNWNLCAVSLKICAANITKSAKNAIPLKKTARKSKTICLRPARNALKFRRN